MNFANYCSQTKYTSFNQISLSHFFFVKEIPQSETHSTKAFAEEVEQLNSKFLSLIGDKPELNDFFQKCELDIHWICEIDVFLKVPSYERVLEALEETQINSQNKKAFLNAAEPYIKDIGQQLETVQSHEKYINSETIQSTHFSNNFFDRHFIFILILFRNSTFGEKIETFGSSIFGFASWRTPISGRIWSAPRSVQFNRNPLSFQFEDLIFKFFFGKILMMSEKFAYWNELLKEYDKLVQESGETFWNKTISQMKIDFFFFGDQVLIELDKIQTVYHWWKNLGQWEGRMWHPIHNSMSNFSFVLIKLFLLEFYFCLILF